MAKVYTKQSVQHLKKDGQFSKYIYCEGMKYEHFNGLYAIHWSLSNNYFCIFWCTIIIKHQILCLLKCVSNSESLYILPNILNAKVSLFVTKRRNSWTDHRETLQTCCPGFILKKCVGTAYRN